MNKEQRKKLKKLLKEKEYWTTKEINELIKDEFGVEYKKLKMRRITTRQKKRANTFGFYAINGNGVFCFQERSLYRKFL